MEKQEGKWEFTKDQKEEFVFTFEDNERALAGLGEDMRRMYKEFLEELCEEGNLEAISIKGYAHYGEGNPIYPCDWEVSRDCMLRLVNEGDELLQAQAANTLGYIYYYGRCNGGVPEYDLAFKYFSLASFFGFYEATYKIGDMLAEGKGIPKNETAALRLYVSVYNDCFEKFQEGDRQIAFVDAALRMGKAHLKGIGVEQNLMTAYACFLQAKLAIELRMKESDFFGNHKVKTAIEDGLEETVRKLLDAGEDFAQNQVNIDLGYVIGMLGFDYHALQIRAVQLADGVEVILQRLAEDENDPAKKVMLTIPDASYCQMTDTVILRTDKDAWVEGDGIGEFIVFDQIDHLQNEIRVIENGEVKLTLHMNEFIFRIGDQML